MLIEADDRDRDYLSLVLTWERSGGGPVLPASRKSDQVVLQ